MAWVCLGLTLAGMLGLLGCARDDELVAPRLLENLERRRERARAPSATTTATRVPPSPTMVPTRTPRPGWTLAMVRRVWDGNTILVDGGYSVRYIGVDTPGGGMFGRPLEPFGREAAERNVALVEGKAVELEPDERDVDGSGFLLRYVYVGDLMVNEVLLQEGLGALASLDRNQRHAAALQAAEDAARRLPLNIWTLITPTPTVTPTPTQTATPTPVRSPLALPVAISPRALPVGTISPTPATRTPTPSASIVLPAR